MSLKGRLKDILTRNYNFKITKVEISILSVGVIFFLLVWSHYGIFLWTEWATWFSYFIPVIWASIRASRHCSLSEFIGTKKPAFDYAVGVVVGFGILLFLRKPQFSGGGMLFDSKTLLGKTFEVLQDLPGAFFSVLLIVLFTFIPLWAVFNLLKVVFKRQSKSP